MSSDRSVVVRVTADVRGFVAGMGVAAQRTRDLARQGQETARQHRGSLDGIADASTKVGLVAGAAALGAVAKWAQFDAAMSRAQAGTQATAGQMAQLRDAAVRAGADTQYSATEAAGAITEMGKAGVGVSDILGGGLKGALDLAAAGELDVAQAGEIAATAMIQFGLSGKDLPHVADLLAAGAGKAQGSVSDMALAMKYVGPVAHGMGVSIEETTGVIAELASQGIIGEQAGTSLRGMLSSLTSPSLAAAKTMARLGIDVYDTQGKFVGMASVAGQLQTALGGQSEAARNAALGTIFGNEQLTAARVLYSGGAQAVQDWTAKVNDSGFAARQAATLTDNLMGDIERLGGSLDTVLIQSGSGANGGLRTLVQGAEAAVNAFGALPPSVQQTTVVLAGVTAGAALLAAGVIKGTLALQRMQVQLAEVGVSGARTRGVLVGVGKAAGALTALSFLPDIIRSVDERTGAVGAGTEKMGLQLAQYAKGAQLAGDAAKVFGADLAGGLDTGLIKTESLKDAVDRLTGSWYQRDLPGIPSQEAQQIESLDKALSGLAGSGHADVAAQAFDRLTRAAGLNSGEVEKLKTLMPQYSETLARAATEQLVTGKAAASMGGDMQDAATKARQLEQKLKDLRKAARESNEAALDKRSAARDYQEALDKAAEAIAPRTRTVHTGGSAGKKVDSKKVSDQAKAASDAAEREAYHYGKTSDQAREAGKAAADRVRAAAKGTPGSKGTTRTYTERTKVTLDIGTEKGREFVTLLDDIAGSAQAMADGILKAGGSQEQYRASLVKSRGELMTMAQQYGMTKAEAREYVDEVLKIPPTMTTLVKAETGEAFGKLKELSDTIEKINGKAVRIRVDTEGATLTTRTTDKKGQTSTSRVRAMAEGGVLAPGVAGREAQIARRAVLWAEAGPEAYIPLAPGKRARSMTILEDVAGRFGMQLVPRQAGGPRVVQVPVSSTHTERAVINVAQVVTRDASSFVAASRQRRFGAMGVG